MFLVILNVFLDNIFCHFISNCANKISIFPKFPSPQFFLNFRVILEYLLGRFTLKSLHYFRYRIPRWKTQKYMNMVLCYFHSLYFKLIGDGYFFKTFFKKFSDITSQYPFSVFGSPNQMIPGIIYRMTCSSYGHAINLDYSNTFLKDNVSSPP